MYNIKIERYHTILKSGAEVTRYREIVYDDTLTDMSDDALLNEEN